MLAVCLLSMASYAQSTDGGGGDAIAVEFISSGHTATSSIDNFSQRNFREVLRNAKIIVIDANNIIDQKVNATTYISSEETLDAVLSRVSISNQSKKTIYLRSDVKNFLHTLLSNPSFKAILSKKGIDSAALNQEDLLIALSARQYEYMAGLSSSNKLFFKVLRDRASQKASAVSYSVESPESSAAIAQ